jgi:hypothetical protein
LTLSSQGTRTFWELYRGLPVEIRVSARKAYRKWQQDAFHPSLHLKKVGQENWSVRVSLHYRALGKFTADGTFLWEWIGTHADYDKKL